MIKSMKKMLIALLVVSAIAPVSVVAYKKPYLGDIILTAAHYIPDGWIECKGQLLKINDYSISEDRRKARLRLFQLIGTTYGGDGHNTFQLPDLRGRVAVGRGRAKEVGNYEVRQGTMFGFSYDITNLHIETATIGVGSGGQNSDINVIEEEYKTAEPLDTHQPSLGLKYIMSLTGDYPPRD
jgi:microcystin-dependent protein